MTHLRVLSNYLKISNSKIKLVRLKTSNWWLQGDSETGVERYIPRVLHSIQRVGQILCPPGQQLCYQTNYYLFTFHLYPNCSCFLCPTLTCHLTKAELKVSQWRQQAHGMKTTHGFAIGCEFKSGSTMDSMSASLFWEWSEKQTLSHSVWCSRSHEHKVRAHSNVHCLSCSDPIPTHPPVKQP